MLSWQTSRVKDIIQQTENTRSYFLEAEGVEHFHFVPGQFVSLDLPISDRPSQRLRSYSIASSPDGSNIFELLVSHKKDGRGSSYLFNEVGVGSEIKFRGPQGVFVLPPALERDIMMICTGTGIAPFRSQINDLFNHSNPSVQIHLIFGTRIFKDVLYYHELTELASKHPNFHYHVVLSRDHPENWNGRKGYVHSVYEEISELGKKDFDFYLCGWRNMITEARERIAAMGYPKERVHLESYD